LSLADASSLSRLSGPFKVISGRRKTKALEGKIPKPAGKIPSAHQALCLVDAVMF